MSDRCDLRLFGNSDAVSYVRKEDVSPNNWLAPRVFISLIDQIAIYVAHEQNGV